MPEYKSNGYCNVAQTAPGDHFHGLTPAELERLAILAEECAEVIQLVGKIIRHGYESCNPLNTDLRTNRDMLLHELTDVQAAMIMIGRDIPEVSDNTIERQQAIVGALHKKLAWSHSQGDDFKEYMALVDRL